MSGQHADGHGGALTMKVVGGQPLGVSTFMEPVYGKPEGL